jgi:hypothetical protein
MSTTATHLNREYDQRIRDSPELFRRVEAATDYFESEYSGTPTDEPTRVGTIRWELSSPNGKPVLVPEFSEVDPNGKSLSIRRFIPLSQADDPVNLEIWMLRMLGDVMAKRSVANRDRINELIRKLEAEGVDDN